MIKTLIMMMHCVLAMTPSSRASLVISAGARPPRLRTPSMLSNLPHFVGIFDDAGQLSLSNIGNDIILSDIYGLPAAFAYFAYELISSDTLKDSWLPSYAETTAWLLAVALASTSSEWLFPPHVPSPIHALLRLRGGTG